ncbi:zinc ribbon domain-containing protein [Candidatus Bathyarchaeota archaeon]|nr:zinc ribbon domain-containing protein [Candidatus Bathyarchaeota archaeon]
MKRYVYLCRFSYFKAINLYYRLGFNVKIKLNAKLISFILILTVFITSFLCVEKVQAAPAVRGRILYVYDIDEDGNTFISINLIYSGLPRGSSWITVPSYLNWSYVISGAILDNVDVKSIFRSGSLDPFWKNFTFSFTSTSKFINLTISYSVPLYTFIFEPDGLFYSSHIEYASNLEGTAEIILPPNSTVISEDVSIIVGSAIKKPSGLLITRFPKNRVLISCSTESNSRIMVYFTLKDMALNEEEYRLGVFTFRTPARYVEYAKRILDLYNKSLPIFLDVFGVNVESVTVTFFLPSRSELLSGLGGYVPFTGGQPGIIHLNIFYMRTISGSIELIALHELTHHMVWYAGVGPSRLWVHEGMAEYFSMEVGWILGYWEAVSTHRSEIESVLTAIGDKYGFVQSWSMGSIPSNVIAYYAASYKIFKTLGDRYGEFEYYKRFFRTVKDMSSANDDSSIITALGQAAGNITEVLGIFKRWGFTGISAIEDIAIAMEKAKETVEDLNILLQPFKLIAQILISMALEAYSRGYYSRALLYANSAVTIAANAPILCIVTYGFIVFFIVRLAYKRRVKPKLAKPELLFCPYCGGRLPRGAVYCPYCGQRIQY